MNYKKRTIMKYNIVTICLLTFTVLFTGCNFLDIVPDNTVEVGSLFEKDVYKRQGVNQERFVS